MIKFDPNRAMDMTKLYLGIDPGETTGWALLRPQMVIAPIGPGGRWQGPVKGLEPLTHFLEALPEIPDAIIFERYVISDLTRMQNSGEIPTIQAIGIVKSYAFRNKIKLVDQLRTVKKQGYGWTPHNKKPGAKAVSHERDAEAHVAYYQVMNGLHGIRRS